MVIVYRSNTGFTQEYAEMLSRAERMKLYESEDAKEKLGADDEVFYMAPVMGGHITGVDKARKRFKIKAVCGVGMSPAAPQVLDTLARSNYLPDVTLFYLQGGWKPQEVSWVKRQMMRMATKSIREGLEARGKYRNPAEEAYYRMLTTGGSFVAFQNLAPIQKWLRGQR